jgi:hypothetical protein
MWTMIFFLIFNTNVVLVLIQVNDQMIRNVVCKVHAYLQIFSTKYIVIKILKNTKKLIIIKKLLIM